jgi:heat shock protein HtpX
VHSHRNGLKTALLLGAMSGLVLLAGSFFGKGGLLLALVIALGMNGYAYFFSAKLALRSMRARPVSREEAPWLHDVVGELAHVMRIPVPSIHVSPTSAPNAFATGRDPEHAAVCVTEGILEILDERELRAVLGHELAHVGNRDILISSVAGALASVIVYLAQFAQMSAMFGGRGQDSRNNPISLLAFALLGPLAAALVQSAVSRSREYQADATGAEVTGDPLALASALHKLELGTAARPLAQTATVATTSSLMIANPFRGKGIGNLFSTHPPMADRIARLEAMARGR